MELLGDILLRKNIISRERLEQILAKQIQGNGRLGDMIIAENICNYSQLYKALSEHYGLEFIDLLENPPDKNLLSFEYIDDYLRFRALPIKINRSKAASGQIVVAISEYSEPTLNWIKYNFSDNVKIVFTSPFDIRRTIERVFGKVLEDESKMRLWRENTSVSARFTVSKSAQNILYFFVFGFFLLFAYFPIFVLFSFVAFCNIAYFFSMFAKMWIFAAGGVQNERASSTDEKLPIIAELHLPVYTILVPMYKEAAIVPKIYSAISALDYPKEKLDIKFILEEDDAETINAALSLRAEHNLEIIRVPPGELRTKPKACNYAMKFARGEYVTIFDADDKPDKLQLKKAIARFESLPGNVVCLQARLCYYNYNDNFLTRFFELEYSILFDVMLRGLEKLRIPIPLGGTSNHIKAGVLKKLGLWDAHNVTEDADLGIRLAAQGFKTSMLNAKTEEEAPIHLAAWIRQRSRWIKGYMQTWIVYMREPFNLYKNLGKRGFFGFQLFWGGACFTFFSAPFLWLIAALYVFLPAQTARDIFPDYLIYLSLFNLLFNFISHWFMVIYCVSLKEESSPEYKVAALFYPFYLILHSVACYRALYQLFAGQQHLWEKTTHGLAKSE